MNHRFRSNDRFTRGQILLAGLAVALLTAALWVALSSHQVARGALTLNPPNDLPLALSQGIGQTPAAAPVQDPAEPPILATPRAACGPGSNPNPDPVDGRITATELSSPAIGSGYTCNLSLLAHQGQSGGFKVLRYIDSQGHECAFYDTALLAPLNAVRPGGPSQGVAVLDMSDPAHPVQTDTLTALPMVSPHESLSLNPKRGLIAAVLGNPNTQPGLVAIYDASKDCRHPVLDSDSLLARFGHEGNFSPDGNTFWAAGTAVKSLTAIDVTDPIHPKAIWQGSEYSHGLTISDDGNRAYVADPTDGQMTILDTSQVQARVPNPQVKEISRLTWSNVTIPQNAIPITIAGHPYVLEFDEYAFRFSGNAAPNTVGAARIVDIADEAHPRIVSDLRLQVDQPAEHQAASTDPGAISPVEGYAAHYCGVPREVDPEIVACSFINSGLRVFDISDPLHPKEIGYFQAPPHPTPENSFMGSDFAMSKPAFAPERREIWYSDGTSGFYVLRVPATLWPDPTTIPSSSTTPGTPAQRRSCPAATGRLRGGHLGAIALGQSRGQAREQLAEFSTRNRSDFDFFCLAGGGIRAGYPSGKLLRSLRRSTRGAVSGRVILALTSDRFYALRGVRPASRLRAAVHKLHPRWHFQVGRNTWYVIRARGHGPTGILKVRHGEVQEVGIADVRLTRTRPAAHRFMKSFR